MLEEHGVKSVILLLQKEHKESPKLQNYGTFPLSFGSSSESFQPSTRSCKSKMSKWKCGKL